MSGGLPGSPEQGNLQSAPECALGSEWSGALWSFLYSGLPGRPIREGSRLAKDLAPYRIGKRPDKQNRAKMHQKYRKSYFLSSFDVFLGYFEGCCVFLSCRGPSLSQVQTCVPQ